MDGNFKAFLPAKRSDLLFNSPTQQRLGNTNPMMSLQSMPYHIPPLLSQPSTLPLEQNCTAAVQQNSEPLDLSKPTAPSQVHTGKTDSKLEQILSNTSSGTFSRKRPYSCLSTKTQRAKLLDNPLTTITPSVVGMHEAPDNPVIMVELSPGPAKATSEKFSSSLVHMMSHVFTISQFSHFSEQEKVALLHHSWHRLMLWSLANDSFTFTVSPLRSQPAATFSIAPSYKRQPTMAFVRGISVFMKKFASLHISAEEFSLLFAITLFHAGKPSQSTQTVEEKRKDLMRQLQTLVQSKSSDPKRYTELLLCLPLLYSVDESMFESLFCGKQFGNGDVKLLLKDAVRKVTRKNCSS